MGLGYWGFGPWVEINDCIGYNILYPFSLIIYGSEYGTLGYKKDSSINMCEENSIDI